MLQQKLTEAVEELRIRRVELEARGGEESQNDASKKRPGGQRKRRRGAAKESPA
jgi:hypothetical protein